MFDRLFQSGKIGTMELRNRTIMPPMYTGLATGGYAASRFIDYLCARASHVGMIILEMTLIEPGGQLYPNQPALFDDRFIPDLSRLAEAVHRHGARVGIQLGHAGALAFSHNTGRQPASASAIKSAWGETSRELSVAEISQLQEYWVRAAARARRAGIDGVEIHCAHGYLLRQFLSPYTNHRTDEYGGSLANRARFPLEVMRAVRQELGRDYPVWFRINCSDFVRQGGFTLSECKKVSRWMVEAGADAVSVSAGTYESPVQMSIQPMLVRRGCLLPYSSSIRKSVPVPVIAAGRINTPELAEKALLSGKADFIALGRELLADPEFIRKAAEGRTGEIRRCLSCNECIDRIRLTDPTYHVSCTVNAALAHEKEYEIKSVSQPITVMVIGGGPAGMEAARIAALRGHRVTLYEKQKRLGGQVFYAARGPHKTGLNNLVRWLSGQLRLTGVKIRSGREVTPATVQAEKPDSVILATGAIPIIPTIPGIDDTCVVTANEVLAGKAVTGQRVIVIGGGRVGMETAEVLAGKGKNVIIVEMLNRLGNDMGGSFLMPAIAALKRAGVKMLISTKAVEIRNGMLVLDKAGEKLEIGADSIVLAAGSRPDNRLASMLKDSVDLHMIGDCARPRNILESIAEGARTAREI